VRIPITSQLALLVLSLASWKAWTEPATIAGPVAAPAAITLVQAPLPEMHRIVVRNAFVGGGSAWLSVCGKRTRFAPMATDARDAELAILRGRHDGCAVRVERRDGDYVAETDTVHLDDSEDDGTIVLELPEHRIGGIGVQLDERDGHVYIHRVFPHGAAAEWGVREGQRVLAVDGVPVRDMEDAHRRIVGSEGSAVRIDFARLHWRGEAWEEFHFELERRSDVE
jgi:membrane-associated protease RseP (regulator of RpoE activity)